jgi:AraC-like DNA-binding protein
MWIAPRGGDIQLCQAFQARFAASDLGWQQTSHYILMLMLGVIRLGAGPDWRPREVQLQTGESPMLREAEALADAHMSFAQPAMAITIPRALLDAPIIPMEALDVSPQSFEVWKASAPARDFVQSIAQVVEMLSWDGYPDIYLTADVLSMSVRTLQRQLALCGVTHGSLVGRARFATASTLLDETDAKVLDIALDLGYSDHAHFTRAFRRWAGCSPQEFRRRRTDGRLAHNQRVYN